jgi:hypothetical protein
MVPAEAMDCYVIYFIPLISFDTTPLPPFDKGDFSFLKKSLVTQ